MDQIERPQTLASSSGLMDYAHLLWRWAWLIVLAALLAGGAAYFASRRSAPTYQTTTRLFISVPNQSGGVDSSGMFFSYNMTTTYAQMITDFPVLQGVVDRLKLPFDPETLRGMITVNEITDSQLISITVSGSDPGQVVQIANSLGNVFADRMSSLQSARYAASRESLKQQVDEMGKQVDATLLELPTLTDPARKQETETRLTQYRQLYASLVSSYEQVRIAEAQNTTNVIIADPARSAAQTGPKTLQNTLLAAVVGVLLVCGIVFGLDALDDTIKGPAELKARFGLPILGVITRHPVVDGQPVTRTQPRSPAAEAYRSLRTNVQFTAVDAPLRRIVITSPTPQDGKTTVAVNLAIVMAQGSRQVALVDADLRRPMVHTRLGLPNSFGLTNLFPNGVKQAETRPQPVLAATPTESVHSSVQPPAPGNNGHGAQADNLRVVTSGHLPPNPAELLSSRAMQLILDRLNEKSEVILIDTPPVLSVTDAVVLGQAADGVVLVVKPGVTRNAALQQSLEQLKAVGARLLGVVLNEVEPRSRKYGYYYRSYYYQYAHYYSEDGKKGKKKAVHE